MLRSRFEWIGLASLCAIRSRLGIQDGRPIGRRTMRFFFFYANIYVVWWWMNSSRRGPPDRRISLSPPTPPILPISASSALPICPPSSYSPFPRKSRTERNLLSKYAESKLVRGIFKVGRFHLEPDEKWPGWGLQDSIFLLVISIIYIFTPIWTSHYSPKLTYARPKIVYIEHNSK